MAPSATAQTKQFVLPSIIIGMPDIMRLLRELENLGEYLHQAALRQTPSAELKLPKTSHAMDALVTANNVDLLHREQFEWLAAELALLEKSAPVIHLSFSTDPSASFMSKIVEWFRANIHPVALIQVGLQPTLAAGCIVRTTNKQFDLSLKEHFIKARPLLIEKLQEGIPA